MGKELTTPARGGNYLATAGDDYFNQLAGVAAGLKGGGDGKAFMKFDGNDGTFSYGADDEPLDAGERMAVNMRSAMWGWVIWVDGNVEHEEMVPMITRQPTKGSLPDLGPYDEDDGPSEQYTIDMRMMEAPNTEMVFQANNASKRRAMAALMKDFANTFRLHPGEVPVIELDEREFETTTKGKGKGRKITKHAPSFKIVDWMLEEELLALTEGSPADYDQDEPAPARRSAAKDEDNERPARRSSSRDAEPAPARRRREEPEPEDEPAPRSRRQREPEPEDEPPARTSRRQREPEPEDEPEPAPRSRRQREPEPEPEDEPPARTSRRQREPEPEDEPEPAPRSRRQAEPEPDDEPAPARRRGRF